MGDMMNASMMGLYGAVVVNNKENKEKARRIKKYLETVHKLKKSESARFPNLEIFGAKEFINLFRR